MKQHFLKKLFVTGGHVTPALAVMEEISRVHPDWNIVFLGRTRALEGKSVASEEEFSVTKAGFRFLPMIAGRLTRVWSVQTFFSLVKIPIGFIQALRYCLQEKPDAIVSFGGYVALPVVFVGWILGIPSITHEQTLVPGLANRMIGWVAKKICVTHEEVARFFPKRKTVVTGLPVRRGFATSPQRSILPVDGNLPLLYITGGTTGAVTLNELIFPIVSMLTTHFQIVHQTGTPSYQRAMEVHNALPAVQQKRYIVLSYLHMPELSWVLHHADLVVGRSGANTVVELAMMGKIAVLVPLPWSGGGEQMQNARWLARHGSAIVINQGMVSPVALAQTIEDLWTHRESYRKNAQSLTKGMPRDGAHRMLAEIEHVVYV